MATVTYRLAQEKISVLKGAKVKLNTLHVQSHFGICWAIRHRKNDRLYLAANSLLAYIDDSLGNNLYLTDWLRKNKRPQDVKYVRKARNQWIDWMIARLEEVK